MELLRSAKSWCSESEYHCKGTFNLRDWMMIDLKMSILLVFWKSRLSYPSSMRGIREDATLSCRNFPITSGAPTNCQTASHTPTLKLIKPISEHHGLSNSTSKSIGKVRTIRIGQPINEVVRFTGPHAYNYRL